MIDKELFKLIGGNKKYIFIAVLLQAIGLIANVTITGSVCYAVYLLTQNAEWIQFIYQIIGAVICSIILNKTKAGRYILCIGSNREAVRLSGVNTKKW